MRSHILTEHEKRLIQTFLETGQRHEGFKVLLHRIRRNYKALKEDLDLISLVLEKAETVPQQ
ncbi:MAG: hypothetical protein QXQ50_02175 [Candidatus Bathyarchaeia archaeon]